MTSSSSLSSSASISAGILTSNAAIKFITNNGKSLKRTIYLLALVTMIYRNFKPSKNTNSSNKNTKATSRKSDIKVDSEFQRKLFRILSIIIPSWRSKEFYFLVLHSFLLVTRTILSLQVASLDGKLVSNLVKGNLSRFLQLLMYWMLIAVPATLNNSLLSFLQSTLSSMFRSNLTAYLHSKLMKLNTFYKINNLDDRLSHSDQLITQDVLKFCQNITELYSNIAKPMLDIVLYNYQLSLAVGQESLFLVSMVVNFSGYLLRLATPPFGAMVAEEQKLEGDFRFVHSRLIECSEEVALYRGESLESKLLDSTYMKLVRHLNKIFKSRVGYYMLEDFVVKYFWGASGLVLCAIPVFFKPSGSNSTKRTPSSPGVKSGEDDLTKSFVTNRRLLLSSSDAVGRILYSYKELAELAGYTQRVYELITTIEDVSENQHYEKKMLPTADLQLLSQKGKVVESENVEFKNVPIVSPNGDVLVREMSFKIQPGMHLLIVGPNGCGKSSMFRILGGLWDVYGSGEVKRPFGEAVFYIPQRPYLVIGTLRDQIIYPHSKEEFLSKGGTDGQLLEILDVLLFSEIVEREGGFDSVQDWKDVLSGGDKQRLAMARLFYHAPRYAILDECTSSVSMEMERIMYTHASELKITLMTVSHRPSLWKYHNWILQFDGSGGYVFAKLDAEKRLALQEEKQALEHRLGELPRKKERLDELLEALG